MLRWIQIWMMTLLVTAAFPLNAQEWIYCPAAPEERERQCRQAERTIHDNLERISAVGDQIGNPDIILAKVLCLHIDDQLLGSDQRIKHDQIDWLSRLGGQWYGHSQQPDNIQQARPESPAAAVAGAVSTTGRVV